jgi:hypothetical protein
MRPADRRRLSPIIAILLVASLATLAGCSDHEQNPNGPKNPEMALNTLVVQRADSTTVAMGNARAVCCGVFDPGFIDRPAIRVLTYDPPNEKSGWEIDIFTDLAIQDTTYTLPLSPLGPANPPAVYMFVLDRVTANELNTSAAAASGTITVHYFSCDGAIQIYVTIDAVLGSELAGQPQVRVQGSFQGVYGANACN